VPSGPIHDIPAVFNNAHVKARGLQVDLQRPDGTQVATVAYPARLSETPAVYHSAPPALGADTTEVLNALSSVNPARLQTLRERGIV